jgi:ABC-2 type transport system ATP-binding protein
MIEVRGLAKRYGDHVAVDGVSFSARAGEVVGLLGPNGAGKSTVMRILAGYLCATSGTASIAGFDVTTQSMEARERLGYLPESGGVYLEMRVNEYLSYRAEVKRVQLERRHRRIEAAIEQCDLGEVRGRIIGQLSKGFRQRVAIAGTLLHQPPVVILDEPTVGLDPLQMRGVRELVRRLGRKRAVLFSTHILSEAAAVCDRVVIVHRGRVLADAVPAEITARAGGQTLEIEVLGGADAVTSALATLPGVAIELKSSGPPTVRVEVRGADVAALERRVEIASALARAGLQVVELSVVRSTLDEAFARLTVDAAA